MSHVEFVISYLKKIKLLIY